MQRNKDDIITIGVDASTRSCGIAVYKNGVYDTSYVKTFPGTFTFEKLKTIIEYFNEMFTDLLPDIVLIEEPLAIRNGRVTRHLNLVGGAIFACAYGTCMTVDFLHNKTVKRLMGISSKADSMRLGKKISGRPCETDDESDAILIVESYKKLTQ